MDPEKPIDTDQANAELRQMAELLRKARGEMEQFGFVTAETSKKLEEMQKQARYNEMWGKKWQIAAGGAATAAVELGSALYKGQTGAEASAKALATFTTNVGDAASTLALLMPGGIIKKSLVFLGGQILKIGGQVFQETAKVSDQLYDAFYKLRDVGAATETGMSGLAGRMVELNYGINEMDKAVALLRNNAQDLATFGGTVGEGAKAFGEFAHNLRENNQRQFVALRRLYGNQDELNKRQAVYISLQTQLGQKTTVSISEFDRMSRATDALTKAFGVQTEELDKANKRNLQETAFRSFLQQMSAGGEEMKQRGNQIMNEVSTLQTKGYTKTAEGIKAALTEQYGSEDFKKLMLAAQQAGVDINQQVRDIKAGRQTVMGFATLLGKSGQRLQGTMSRIAQQTPEIFEETFGALPELLDIAAGGDLRDRTEKGAKATDAMAAGLDKAGEEALRLRLEQEKTRNTLQSFIKEGIVPATTALANMATVVNKLVGEKAAADAKKAASPGGVKGAAAGAATLGAAGAVMGSALPIVGTVAGGAIGAIVGGVAGSLGMIDYSMPGRKPEDVIEFGDKSGSRVNYENLDGKIKESFFQMALEYNQLTGKKLKFNSGFRSEEDQRRLIETNANQGRPIAEPGASKHQQGLAVDVNTDQAQFLRDKGLLAKYGFKNDVPNDPSHLYAERRGFKEGGISDGPDSGYMALLHGLEAIVPLSNNRSIPVSFREPNFKSFSSDMSLGKELPSISESIDRQSQVLQQQLAKADAMLQAFDRFANADQVQVMIDKLQTLSDKMNTSNDINSRILQVSM